jgi:flagellar basal body rod protein FlgC
MAKMQNYYNDDTDQNFVYDPKNPADDLDPDVKTTPTVPPVPKEEEALTMSKARNYQLEMLRESLKGNVIVVVSRID